MDPNKKIIAFDFFGVICSEVAPFWFQRFFSEEKASELKNKYLQQADIGKISLGSLFSNLEELTGATPEQIQKDWLSLAKINNDVVSVIEFLQKNYRIVLFSNAVPKFLRKILKENNLERLFDSVVISSEIGVAKPDLAFFRKALKIIKASPEEVFFIDDNLENIQAAGQLGIQSVVYKDLDTLNIFKK
jgi:putative hydrolase of the HAD superfamily